MPHLLSRLLLTNALSLLTIASAFTPAFAAASKAPAGKAFSIPDIFATDGILTAPPAGLVWSPDGTRLTYLSSSSGDLMQVEGATGKQSVLVSKAKLASVLNTSGNEQDKDHRDRYKQSSYIWMPDSQHLLFNSDGELWLYSIANGTAVNVASTGTGSGDDPQFSPDGKSLTYLHDRNLYLLHLQFPRETPAALTNTHEDGILNGQVDWVYEEELDVRSNYSWSPDSKSIAYLQMNDTALPKYPIVDWIPVHAAVSDQRYPQPGDPNPNVRVGVVHVGSSKTQWLKIPLQAGDDYIPRFGWINANVVWVETLSRDHKHRSLYFADIGPKGEVRKVLSEADDKFFDERYDLTFDGNKLLWLSWRDGHTHIYEYDYQVGSSGNEEAKLVKQLTTGDFDVSAVKAVDEQRQMIYYLSSEGDAREQQLWAIGMDGTQKHRVTSQVGVHDVVFSHNGRFYSDEASSLMVPPTVSVCRNEKECNSIWTSPSIAAYDLAAPEQMQLQAADGKTTLYATLQLPAGKLKKEHVPLIVNPYGGPGVQTVRNAWNGRTLLFDEILAKHGFAVLHVDNRGMSGRGRDFEQAAYHNFGPVQLEDQLAALDQVLSAHKELDPQQLGWWGWSWGGSFTLYAMTHADRFKAGVAVAPVTDWRNYDSIYTERYMGTPAENADGYRDNSAVNSAKDLKGRLLLVHGTGDDNVHLGNSIQFIQKLIDADLPYDLQLYPRKTHSIAGQEARTHLYERILAQFEMYLGRDAPGQKALAADEGK